MWLTVDELKKRLDEMRLDEMRTPAYNGTKYFFAAGTGVSDEVAIEYFKESSDVTVVDRKGRCWKKGVLCE